MPQITDVVKHLLFLNIIMFLIDLTFQTNMLALYYPYSDKFMPVQIVTHFFMHANFMHLFFNMFALVMFGSALEMYWGPKRFLSYYLVCAFGAAILHTGYSYIEISHLESLMEAFKAQPVYENFWAFFNATPLPGISGNEAIFQELSREVRNGNATVIAQSYDEMQEYLNNKMNIPVVGASGAIYGLLLGFGMKFPNAELMLLFLPVPIKAKYFIPILMLGELILGVNNFSWDNIAHFAHLGGALAGFLMIMYWRKFSANPW